MLCQSCRRRERCRAACVALEAHLLSREKLARETILDPGLLVHVANHALMTLADLQPDGPGPWDGLACAFPALPAELVELFLMRYQQGLSLREIARRQNVHHVTIGRRLRRAIALIKKSGATNVTRYTIQGRN